MVTVCMKSIQEKPNFLSKNQICIRQMQEKILRAVFAEKRLDKNLVACYNVVKFEKKGGSSYVDLL